LNAFRAADPPKKKPPSLNYCAQTHPPRPGPYHTLFPFNLLRPAHHPSISQSFFGTLSCLEALLLVDHIFFLCFLYSPVLSYFFTFPSYPPPLLHGFFGRSCLAQILTFLPTGSRCYIFDTLLRPSVLRRNSL
jgi:hypothetical protein